MQIGQTRSCGLWSWLWLEMFQCYQSQLVCFCGGRCTDPRHIFWLSFSLLAIKDFTLFTLCQFETGFIYWVNLKLHFPPFLLLFSNHTKMVSSKSVCIAVHLRFTICVCECTSPILRNTVQITDLFSFVCWYLLFINALSTVWRDPAFGLQMWLCKCTHQMLKEMLCQCVQSAEMEDVNTVRNTVKKLTVQWSFTTLWGSKNYVTMISKYFH